jgi:hypothetical protein
LREKIEESSGVFSSTSSKLNGFPENNQFSIGQGLQTIFYGKIKFVEVSFWGG